MKPKLPLLTLGLLVLAGGLTHAAPLGAVFTYQGRLDYQGQPANGTYAMRFALYDAPSGGNLVNGTNLLPVTVVNGVFTADLNFGPGAFTGDARWLEISVSTNNAQTFDVLLPSTRIAPAPHALYAATAGTVTNGAISVNQLATGTTPPLPGQVLSYNGSALAWQGVSAVSGAWSVNGNSATPGQFVGTTGNQALELRVNNARAARLEPTAGAPNIILGRGNNAVSAGVQAGTIGGGEGHSLQGNHSVIAGGNANVCGSNAAFVGGGTGNEANGSSATLTGGYDNTANGSVSFIGGGENNRADGPWAVVAGGFRNTASANAATVAGGSSNEATNGATTVGGGYLNRALGYGAVIAGGEVNTATGGHAAVAGGEHNTASADYGTIAGGSGNQVTGIGAGTVGGGVLNTASGDSATVPGGYSNRAQGRSSLAAGNAARALHDGSFVWADRQGTILSPTPYESTAANQFSVRAAGGVRFQTRFLEVSGDGNERAYIGGDGVGNEVQVGSLNPTVTRVAIFNSGSSQWMNLAACSLTVVGGCDLAEPFPMKEAAIEKGSVVVIDSEHPGQLKRSTRAYDRRVAGIVSGANGINPGIALTQAGVMDQGENVALAGRVYVKADAAQGAIEPGDLLTTSDNPGHAMKVVEHALAQGAILGKAMSTLKEGTGLVLVLVTLQ